MAERSVISVHTDPEIRERLERLAKATRRSKSFLANEAITRFLDQEEWMIAEIEAGLADKAAGRVVAHDAVTDWATALGTAEQRPAPRAGKV